MGVDRKIRIVAVIQSRMGSSRLPRKALADIDGEPMLARVIARAQLVRGLVAVAVATTHQRADRVIVALCRDLKIPCIRGPEDDVLARYALAAETLKADAVVRLCGDSPLIDPAVVEQVLEGFLRTPGCAYASNCHPPSWYSGTDVEVISAITLRRANLAARPIEREHVTTSIWRKPWAFPATNVSLPGADYSAIELSVNTPEELERVRRVVKHLPSRWWWRQVLNAYWATEIEGRAGKLFGHQPRKAGRRRAYASGALAELVVGCANPYSTGVERELPLHAAWQFGREDATRFLTTVRTA